MRPRPLSKRPIDIALIVFFGVNLFFGPFYAVAIYAYARGRNWIRFGRITWASVMLTNVSIILFEEVNGEHATPELGRVLLSNAALVVFPVVVLWRMWRSVAPFSANG